MRKMCCVLYLPIFLMLQIAFVEPVQWYCNTNTDCTATDSFCAPTGLCQCKDGQIFSSDRQKCLPISTSPDYDCKDDNQCLELTGGHSACNKNNCACIEGYRYLNNVCVIAKDLGGTCTTDLDCYDGISYNSMICSNNICKCNTGYYDRASFDCRPSAKVTGTCFFDLDCENEDLICDFGYGPTGKCITKNATITKNEISLREAELFERRDLDLSCTADTDCSTKIQNSYCPKYLKKCICNSGFVFKSSLNKCVGALGSSCTDKCELRNSDCINNICQCKYYFINGYLNEKCFKPARGIDYSCVHDKNCQLMGKNAVCSDKKCSCNEKSTFFNEYMLCRSKNSGSIGCTINSDCTYKAHSECKSLQCVCVENYRDSNDKCLPNIGASCSVNDNDCDIANAECLSDKCVCQDNFIANGPIACVPVVQNITEPCQIDEQCKGLLGIGAKCDTNKCDCLPDYIYTNNTCVLKRYFGDYCNTRKDCNVVLKGSHVRCQNSKCLCDYGFKPENLKCVADSSGNTQRNIYYVFVPLLCITIFNML